MSVLNAIMKAMSGFQNFHLKDLNLSEKQNQGVKANSMKWVCEEFKPLIDQEAANFAGSCAHSCRRQFKRGLMALYTVLHHNDVFALSAAVSPYLWHEWCPFDREVNKNAAGWYQDLYQLRVLKNAVLKQSLAQYSAALINIAKHPSRPGLFESKVEGMNIMKPAGKEIPCFMNYLYLQRRH